MSNPTDRPESLGAYHPLVAQWFVEEVGPPTDVQQRAWPVITAGNHTLVTAPTGTGKTLTAFLWAINQLATGAWANGQTRVLYVSPLRALNNDIERNLLGPLAALETRFKAAGAPWPHIGVQTRSGDTPQADRQRMLRRPPEILITTPESLNILLSSKRALAILSGLSSVILDEIHAVAGTKRGTHLITAVDRLVRLSGEFQRIALSATVAPAEAVADFVGGYELGDDGAEPRYRKRPVTIVRSDASKAVAVEVRSPEAIPSERGADFSRWPVLIAAAKEIIHENRATLIFANSRRLCERLSLLLNEDEEHLLAYAHHGSLSREMRTVVERRLKEGDLSAIVATNSLELGIDIGDLDAVVLMQTPPSVSGALQRIGRSGHRVGAVSKGVLFPTHGRDFLDAAVMAKAVAAQDIEPIRPIQCPLDVLAQVMGSMTGTETWDIDALYAFLRCSAPYHSLSRPQFDLVLDMLAGRYGEGRIRALDALVRIDRLDNTVTGSGTGLRRIYLSGGTIPDRGYYTLRREDSKARIGELDEEFVWERKEGETFTLGTQRWRISRITHNEVLVAPGTPSPTEIPFWKGEEASRSRHLAERQGEFLEWAEAHLDDPEFEEMLQGDCGMEEAAAEELTRYLQRQRTATGTALPHRHHIAVEHSRDLTHGAECTHIILHTLWGGTVNQPFAFGLAQAWEDRFGYRVEVYANNDTVEILAPDNMPVAELFDLVAPEDIESLLRRRLEQTGFFGARFRENAGTALLLPRRSFKERMPLWLNRLRSKKLLDAVMRYEDFPILAETWRTCLRDEFDLDGLREVLREVEEGRIRVSEVRTAAPSPFAQAVAWRQTNKYMYMDDTPEGGRVSRLSEDLLAEVVHSAELRPRLAPALIAQFRHKAQCVYPGYAPSSGEDLLAWLKERLYVPEPEWAELLEACRRDHGVPERELLAPLAGKAVWVTHLPEGRGAKAVVALEALPRMMQALGGRLEDFTFASLTDEGGPLPAFDDLLPLREVDEDRDPLEQWLLEWLRFYGPLDKALLQDVMPLEPTDLDAALESLLESRAIVVDHLTEDATRLEVCEAENLEILLRMARAGARPAFEALDVHQLPLFLAAQQSLIGKCAGRESLQQSLEGLLAYPMDAPLLEEEILPARLDAYSPAELDSLLQQSDLFWFGCGPKKIALGFPEHLALCQDAGTPCKDEDNPVGQLLPDAHGHYPFTTLLEHTQRGSSELTEALWDAVWQGTVANDSFEALRKGIQTKFRPAKEKAAPRGGRRGAFNRWRATRPFAGHWYAVPQAEPPADALEAEEYNRDRVRVLLDRYGLLFRELLQQELPAFRWGALFRTLRLMELSGEVTTGQFFEGIPGLQFVAPAALRRLRQGLPGDAVYWMNATDPASVCGLGLEGLRAELPRRVATTHLVYRGPKLVIVSQRRGKVLDIREDPGSDLLPACLEALAHPLKRAFRARSHITVEAINGEFARTSPYLDVFRSCFDVESGPKNVTLRTLGR